MLYRGLASRAGFQFRRHFSSGAGNKKRTLASLGEADLKGKNVFVRVDFNVPLNKETGAITDDTRIRAALPTIQHLQQKGARTILASHMGRPKPDKPRDGMYLAVASEHLAKVLGTPVNQASDCIGEEVKAKAAALNDGDILMLENFRFHPEETKNVDAFAKQVVDDCGAQVYVNDAFGTAHRAHASTEGVVKYIPGAHVAGYLLSKELEFLQGAIDAPKKPFAAIVGGAKVSTKIGVIESLMEKCDKIVLGGAMVFTFYKARGLEVGASMVEEPGLALATKLEQKAKDMGVELLLPEDVVVADSFSEGAASKVVSVEEIPEGWMGLDVGPQFNARVSKALKECNTILWNGPMGVFEWPAFAKGTLNIAQTMAEVSSKGGITIVGGGDSVAAVTQFGLAPAMSHISTGGGASLELLEGRVLPGVAALDNA